jgi:hypothetical protein
MAAPNAQAVPFARMTLTSVPPAARAFCVIFARTASSSEPPWAAAGTAAPSMPIASAANATPNREGLIGESLRWGISNKSDRSVSRDRCSRRGHNE